MKVDVEPLPGDLPIEALRAQESCPEGGIHAGELVGFHCVECGQVDETLRQIIHEDGCPLAGEHGRDLYDDLPQLEAEVVTPELDDEHTVTMFEADFSGRDGTAKNGCVVAFRCDECGNSDEALFEIVHDEACSLAGRHGDAIIDGESATERDSAAALTQR